jgi:tetratricopeptide (TPR) repeat protein
VNSMHVPPAIILDTSDRASSVSGATLPRMGSATGVDCVDWYRSEQRASTWLATISGSQCPGANQSANVGHFCLMESTESGASYNNFATLPGAPVHLAQDAWSSLGYGRGPLSWLTKILLDLACLYLDMSSLTEALNCIEEAATATQMCPAIVYLRGRYLEHLEMWREAKKLYEGVLSMCPEHVEVRQRLARILLDLGQIELAEKILRDAISIDASSCTTWQLLGETLQMMNQREGAKHCLMVSLDLECTQPLVDFQELPRGIGSACV